MRKEDPRYPYVQVVLPHYCSSPDSGREAAQTRACVDSVCHSDYPSFDITIVDAGSRDRLHQEFRQDGVTYLRFEENLGCAASFNRGAEHAISEGARYAFLINNDVVVSPDTLSKLVSFAQAHPEAGTVGPKVLTLKAGQKTDLIQTIGGRFIGGNFAHWQIDRGQFEKSREVDFVAGAAMLLRGLIIQELGLFDPRYFIWYEELDFGIRLRKAGYKAYYCPSNVWHEGSQSLANRYSPRLGYYSTRNLLYTIRKHELPWKFPLFLRLILVESKTLFGAAFIARDFQTLSAVARGLQDGLRDNL